MGYNPSTEQDGHRPDGGHDQDEAFEVPFIDLLYQEESQEKPQEQNRDQPKVDGQALQGDGLPDKDVKGEFEEVGDEEKPGQGADKFVLGQAHGQEKNIGQGAGQIADHGAQAGHDPHGASKGPVGGHGFRFAAVPPNEQQ